MNWRHSFKPKCTYQAFFVIDCKYLHYKEVIGILTGYISPLWPQPKYILSFSDHQKTFTSCNVKICQLWKSHYSRFFSNFKAKTKSILTDLENSFHLFWKCQIECNKSYFWNLLKNVFMLFWIEFPYLWNCVE